MDRVDYESVVIQDLANFHKREELNLNPWYQRRSVWTDTQRSYLINSIFSNKPVPTCYIRHYLDVENERSIKEVVDGQQRLRAILAYLADEFGAPQEAGGKRVKFSALSQAERTKFRMQKISIGYLIDASNEDVIDIFGRLNSVSKTLNAQEKRNAKFSGAMKQLCLKQGSKYVDFWRDTTLFTATEISRMDEVQFTSDLIYNLRNGLSDFSQSKLDNFYKEHDEEVAKAADLQTKFDSVMASMASVEDLLRNTIFSRSPLFFSLFLVLASKKTTLKKLRAALGQIDEIYTAIDDRGPQQRDKDAEFYNACIASTQRIKSRQVRHDYILAMM